MSILLEVIGAVVQAVIEAAADVFWSREEKRDDVSEE
jgi:hypothetical protein